MVACFETRYPYIPVSNYVLFVSHIFLPKTRVIDRYYDNSRCTINTRNYRIACLPSVAPLYILTSQVRLPTELSIWLCVASSGR